MKEVSMPSPAVPARELEFRFEGGHLALAFTATVGERWRANFERLTTPGRLGEWIRRAGLASRAPAVDEVLLDQARLLREGVYRALCARMAGRPIDTADVGLLNTWADRPRIGFGLDLAARRQVPDHPDQAARALGEVAARAVELLTDEATMARVRECAAPDCALLFLDASRPGRRRWCSEQGCGTRSRTRRRRASATGAGRGSLTA